MSEKEFWKILSDLDWSKKGDLSGIVEPVIRLLKELSYKDLSIFEEKIEELMTAFLQMDIEEYDNMYDDIITEDDFITDRCVAVIHHTDYYQAVRMKKTYDVSDTMFEVIFYTLDNSMDMAYIA